MYLLLQQNNQKGREDGSYTHVFETRNSRRMRDEA